MNKNLFFLGLAVVVMGACNETGNSSGEDLKSERERFSYSLGMDIGTNVKQAKVDSLDMESLAAGMTDVLNGKQTKISEAEGQQIVRNYFMKKQQAELTEAAAKGKKFLEDNAKKPGVVTLPSGLQYKVITLGTGPKPGKDDKVKVHYHGTLINGKVFDSSKERGIPAEFPVGGVIAGWTEGLQLMPVGSKYMFFIPSNLAYGEMGGGDVIAPNSTLIFEVELLDILKK